MITARMREFEAHPMDYFNLAWNGEDVFIPGSGNRNVCIISESEYKRLQEARKDGEHFSEAADNRTRELLARSVEELRLV